MRRLRNDLPYTFRPPKVRWWVRPFLQWANRRLLLEKKYRIGSIDERGFGKVKELVDAGDAVLLAPNHADHSDPHLMMEIGSRHRMPLHFMGAREIFEVSSRASWALQSMGVFSVDRDGPDLSAIKTAIGLLADGVPLVVYPEGEIYHHHERLDPLHEGVASILLKAAGRLSDGRKAWLVPVGMRFHHDPAVESTFVGRLNRLEDRIGWTPRPSMPTRDRTIRLGTGLLGLKEIEFLGEAIRGELQDRLCGLCERLLGEVEERHGRDPKAGTPPERVRALRYRLRRRLLDEKEPALGEARAALLDDLDRVFTALQAHSYVGDYLLAEPTVDRHAETIMKLEEDLFGFPTYPTERRAAVAADDPICVSDLIESGELTKKEGAGVLTGVLEKRLTRLLASL
ncbi:phosphate acyltransferases [Haloferula helveola]|uniref:Phosphate acyltransferases n=1 Tax=Haloferula helveola TaxID=490095 RepID=A0ABM7RAI9_9BACT|nr:phosphate acyltransferases [Haloferula helveola]